MIASMSKLLTASMWAAIAGSSESCVVMADSFPWISLADFHPDASPYRRVKDAVGGATAGPRVVGQRSSGLAIHPDVPIMSSETCQSLAACSGSIAHEATPRRTPGT